MNTPSPPFPETPDIESSTDDYATRFAGPVGHWMLATQERLTRKLLADLPPDATILDVGGGHGQLAIPLSRGGYRVTVLGSDPSCAHRIQTAVDDGSVKFVTGNLIALPFDDQSFDAVISFRILTHCERWPQLITELSRVARRAVVLDYSAVSGIHRLAPRLFDAKKKLEGNTRVWRPFQHSEVINAFSNEGFAAAQQFKQFFLPMALHRLMRCRPLSAGLEACCRVTGLTRLSGSPVIARFDRISGFPISPASSVS